VHLQATPVGAPTMEVLPVFDLAPFVRADGGCGDAGEGEAVLRELADGIADCLRRTGCLIVRDPRVPAEENEAFLDLMETYFCQDAAVKQLDCRPEFHYQVRVCAGLEGSRRTCLLPLSVATCQGRERKQLPSPSLSCYLLREGTKATAFAAGLGECASAPSGGNASTASKRRAA
jgi:hypothetical protein